MSTYDDPNILANASQGVYKNTFTPDVLIAAGFHLENECIDDRTGLYAATNGEWVSY